MVDFARALSALGLDIITFNFPYIEQRRRIPDRPPVLEDCFRSVIDAVEREVGSAAVRLFIGGKSMGGRIATQVAAADRDRPLAGLVVLGYPLHPPGRPAERRDRHLGSIGRRTLIVQGSRDAFGTPAELAPVLEGLEPPSTLQVVEGGDHSFRLARANAAAQAAVYERAQQVIAEWVLSGRAPG
jgi:predicted alpha/beta-hydrolase family hydrolase